MRGCRRAPPTQDDRAVLEDIARHMDPDPVSDIMMFNPERLSAELVKKLDAKYGSSCYMMEMCIRDLKGDSDLGKDDPYAIGAKRAMLRFLCKHIEVTLRETDAMVLAEIGEDKEDKEGEKE